jgi:excinuclease ABC subunit A
MHFLPDVYVPCEVCKGARYNRDTLDVTFKGKNIAEVLELSIEEALEFFANQPTIARHLQTLVDVGLGYVRLGQPAPTLSGGEAQRVKLSTELSKRSTGRTLYILDEPTTGLSFEDTRALLEVLQRLVDGANTVVVIEHHIDVMKNADHIIDLGPMGGDRGGEIIAQGTPEEVALVAGSFTGDYLKKALPKERVAAVRHGKQQTANGKGARTNGAKIGVTSNGAGSTKGVGARLASPASGRNGAKPANTKKHSTTKAPAKAR